MTTAFAPRTAAAPPSTAQTPVLRALVSAQLAGRFPRSIAVVGNAPVTPSAARAALIDGCDLVLRMTTFALDAEVPAIGRRTDVVLLHRATVAGPDTFAGYRRRLYLLAEPGRSYWEPEAVPSWWPADLAVVPISNREFTKPLRRALRLGGLDVSWPTTGTLAVHLMGRLFPNARLLLAGTSLMEPTSAPRRSLDHQWGEAMPVTAEHRLEAERRHLGDLVADGRLEVLS